MKKFFLTIFVLLTITVVIAMSANMTKVSAATYSGSCGTNVNYTLDTSTWKLTISGTGAMYGYLSESYNGTYATSAPWGQYYSSIKTVTINNGVTSIGMGAFLGCTGLTSITIPSSVTSIDWHAFEDCTRLTSITIPDSVTSIGSSAFWDCTGLTSITIPDSVTSIGWYAFNNTAWYNNQPDGLVYAGKVSYKYKGTCPSSVTIKNGTVGIADNAFYKCTGLTSVTIPDSVTIIGEDAFSGCTGLTSITIPDSVTSIGNSAFSGCKGLTSITIGNSVTIIGDSAFYNCTGLTSIIVDKENSIYHSNGNCLIKTETKELIMGCKTTVIPTDGSVTSIGGSAFYRCTGLTSIIIPDSVTSIGKAAFHDCTGLTSITIPDSVTSIGEYAFYNCTGLTNITIPDSVTSIGNRAFSGCTGIKEMTVPGTINMFKNFGYTYPTWVKKVTIVGDTIGDSAFSGCTGLTSITIPSSVTSIGSSAFSGCTGIKSLFIPDNVIEIGGSFQGSARVFIKPSTTTENTLKKVNAPYNYYFENLTYTISDEKAKITGLIDKTVESLEIPENVDGFPVVALGNNAFSGCTGLTNITISDLVTSIGNNAFSGCTGLTSITIPDSVTSIGGSAFEDCTGLTSITIPDSVTSIGDWAFSGCTGLTSITIPDSVTSIGGSAFYNCTGLTSITIPDSVTSIGSSAFSGCSGLTEMTIPFVGGSKKTSSNTYQYPFGYIFGTSSYTGGTATTQYYYGSSTSSTTNTTYYIPTSLKKVTVTGGNILYGAFYNCSKLTSISIPDSVTNIGGSAFYNCSKLTSISIPDSVYSIGRYAFNGTAWYSAQPNGVVYAGKIAYTYKGKAPASITVNEETKCIAEFAFANTNSENIFLPDGITNVGDSFQGSAMIFIKPNTTTEATLKNASVEFNYYNGYLIYTISEENAIIIGLIDKTVENVDIPESVDSYPVVAIGNALTKITSIDPEENDRGVFQGCISLKDITIPDSVISIGDWAFSGCTGLTSITIPDSVTSIGYGAFSFCSSLETVVLSKSLTEITSMSPYENDGGVFQDCISLKEITIPDSVIRIGDWAFYGCTGLTSITIPDSVTSIGDYAFNGCTGLTSITIPDSVTSIDYGTFSGCTGLTSVTIPDSVTSIGNGAFSGCTGLTSVTIPDSVTSIGDSAFYGCSNLKSITLPFTGASPTANNGYDTVFGYIFGYTTKYNSGNSKTSSSTSYTGTNASTTPTGTTWQYSCYDYQYSSSRYYLQSYYYYIPDSLKSVTVTGEKVNDYAFNNCTGLTNITFSGSVKSISYKAFSGCTGLESFNVPDSATSINNYAFEGCTGLTNLTIPDSVTSIGIGALSGCKELKNTSIPSSVKSINESAFFGCSGIEFLTIPPTVTFIGKSAFSGMKPYALNIGSTADEYALRYIKSNNLSYTVGYGSEIFWGYDPATKTLRIFGSGETADYATAASTPWNGFSSEVKHIVIDEGITYLGNFSFRSCTSLEDVTFGNPDITFGYYVFPAEFKAVNPHTAVLPELVYKTDSSVQLKELEGYEYRMGTGEWQSNPLFEGLNEGAAYTFTQRIAENSVYAPSEISEVLSVTTVLRPSAPTLASVEGTTVTLRRVDGVEYSLSGEEWQTSPVFENVPTDIILEFCARTAATEISEESKPSAAKKVLIVGEPKVYSLIDGVLTFVENNNVPYEYSTDGVAWQTSPTFEDVPPIDILVFQRAASGVDASVYYLNEGVTTFHGTHTEGAEEELKIGSQYFKVIRCSECGAILKMTEFEKQFAGDANGDEEISALDIVHLKKLLSQGGVAYTPELDANGDGVVDSLDVVRLKRYFAEYDIKTGRSTVVLGKA